MTRYKDAGVDIDRGEEAVHRIKEHVRSTFGEHVVTDVGAFAGVCRIPGGDPDRLLVASMDGVGTKLKVALLLGRHDTVGEDLVNHCVGDIAVHGARPLFFLDYVAMGALDPGVVEEVVRGLARGCRANGCALLGGETAEMPGLYEPPDYDLAGCIVGTVDRKEFVNGSGIRPGDVLLGLSSTGLHTNGYSLARKVLFEDAGLDPSAPVPGTETAVGDALLAVHRSYLRPLTALEGRLLGAAHITGGGIPGNLSRVLPQGVEARVNLEAWTAPPLFRLIAERGKVPEEDMVRSFNLGVGLVAVVRAGDRERCLELAGPGTTVIGETAAGDGGVVLEGRVRW